MSLSRFTSGITLLDKVVIQLNNLEKYSSVKDVSFVYFINSESKSKIVNIETLKKHPLTKNIIIVGDIDVSSEKIVTINPEKWNKDKDNFYKMTKNSFVITELEMSEEDYYSMLNEYRSYYPICLIFTDVKLKKGKSKESGFGLYAGENIFCAVNQKLKNFDSYHVENFESLQDKQKEGSQLMSMRSSRNIFGKKSGPKVDLTEDKIPIEKSDPNLEFLIGLPSPSTSQNLNKYNVPTSKQWYQEFYEYLRELCKRFFPKERHVFIDKILTNDTIKKSWIPSFTHSSANPNINKNYESIEPVGDKILGYCFKLFLKLKEPYATEARLNNLDSKYMSKTFQARVAKEMKLDQWLIIQGVPVDRLDNLEDLLEAFCGTIDMVLYEKAKSVGYGSIVIFNLLKLIFGDFTFQEEKKKSSIDNKTFVFQTFQGSAFYMKQQYQNYVEIKKPDAYSIDMWRKLVDAMNKILSAKGETKVLFRRDSKDHKGIEVNRTIRPDGKTMIVVSILKDYAMKAREFGIDIPVKDVEIGRGVSGTVNTADKIAFKEAREYMEDKGMTMEWRNKLSEKSKFMFLSNLDKVYEKALEVYPDLVSEPVVERIKVGVDFTVYQLQGKTEDGTIVPIYTEKSYDNQYDQQVIDNYLNS